MIHRSIISAMERMVAHLLEVHDGSLPVWLAPTQVLVLPVGPGGIEHAHRTHRTLLDRGIRSELDERGETLASRVRDAQRRRIPYLSVVGEREARAGTVAVRLRSGERHTMGTAAFVDLVGAVSARRLAALTADGGAP